MEARVVAYWISTEHVGLLATAETAEEEMVVASFFWVKSTRLLALLTN